MSNQLFPCTQPAYTSFSHTFETVRNQRKQKIKADFFGEERLQTEQTTKTTLSWEFGLNTRLNQR